MFNNRYDNSFHPKFHKELPNTPNPKPAVKKFWSKKFIEFCKRTDLHGYKYIVMEELNATERKFWAVAVLISIAFATYLVVAAYKWYAKNPIVTVIESTQGAIWDIPFPAVTICDLNIISRRAARVFADKMHLPVNVTADSVFSALRLSPLLHSTHLITEEQKVQLYLLQQVLDLNKMSVETMFTTLSPAVPCSKMVERCMWKNIMYRCDHLFQQVYTMYGICCTFNYYALKQPEVHKNVDDDLIQLTSPRRVASCGYQTALTVLLNTDPDDYYSAIVASQGTLVFIDSAYNVPNQDSPVRMVNPSTEVMIALTPERTYTTSGIKAFRPDQRHCYYSDEVNVGEFSRYSLHNCMAYQRMQLIKKTCECVPFYFPIKDYPRLCNFHDMECLENALRPNKDEMAKIEKEYTFTCLPECEHYDYPIEVAMGKLAKHVQLSGLPLFNNVKLENRSLLNVFFNDLVSTKFRRDVYFNWQNFLAAFGGLLSLMLGFTLISGVDVIFFFTFRLVYDLRNKQAPKKKPLSENDTKVNNWIENSKRNRPPEHGLEIWKPTKIGTRF